MVILSSILSVAVQAAPDLLPLIVLAQVNLSWNHGNAPESTYAYVMYGLILANMQGDIEAGYRFGQLGMNLLNHLHAPKLTAKTIFGFNNHLRYLKEPAQDTLNGFLQAYMSGLETGDLEYVALSLLCYDYTAYLSGQELLGLKQTMDEHRKVIQHFHQDSYFHIQSSYYQTVLNLLEWKDEPDRLFSEHYDEEERIKSCLAINKGIEIYQIYFNKLLLAYLFKRYENGLEIIRLAEQYEQSVQGFLFVSVFSFYTALTQLALYSEASQTEQNYILERVAVQQNHLDERATHAPSNYSHRCLLVAAERCRVLDQKAEAIDLYDRAILGAKANQYLQEEALANELAAKFYLDWGKEKVAAGYMQEAYYCYDRWGAKAKTDRLETEYPQLLQPILQQVFSSTFSVFEPVASLIDPASFSQCSTRKTASNKSSSSHSLNQVLDSAALLQVSQAISSTIDLDGLLQILTQTMLKTSGGDRCVLLLCQNNQWQVRAIANLQETILESVPLENNSTVPIRLIQYIKNTSETVVINNLTTDLPGIIDDYLYQYQPKSILSLPILNQGNLVGILYLENSLVSNVFTSDRLLALNVLATQAAISLENTRLYQLEQQRFQQLQEQTSLLTFRSAIDSNSTRSGPLQEMLQRCTEIIVDSLDAAFARIWTVSVDGSTLELQASAGLYTHLDGDHSQVPIGQFKIGLIAQERLPHLTNDVLNDPRVGNKAWAASEGMVSFAGYPLLVDDQLLGVIALFARRPLETSILDALAITAYEISLGLNRKQTEIALQISESHLRQKSQDLEQALEQVKDTQLQMIQSEKMSVLGNLVAGVAHEINNPIGFLNGSIKNLKEYTQDLMGHLELYQQHYPNPVAAIQDNAEEIDLEFVSEDLPKLLNSMTGATDRIKGISTSLRNFSRADTEYKVSTNLHEGIDSTLQILKYRLKADENRPEIQVHRAYGELPSIKCFSGQLNQVFMNILANAIDMFDETAQQSTFTDLEANPQIITIKTALTEQNTVEIRIHDNGKGISEDVRARIFDHLFTTKGVGKGTGLG
jgi:GAF domain-containing protein